MFLVYRYRVKSLNGLLNKQARAVNFVYNYCNDRQKDALKWGRKWLTKFDLIGLTTGGGAEVGLHSDTIEATCDRYVQSRRQSRRPYLRYRGKKSLGWVPLRGRSLRRHGDAFRFAGHTFRVFNSRPLPEGKIKDGTNFSRDRRGNWFLNIVIEVEDGHARQAETSIGIDLGLKDFATLSTGEKFEAQRIYRGAEQTLSLAQRAGKKRQAKTIHAKITNRRKDFLHKLSTRLVREHGAIFVGNVKADKLVKTTMAKSVLDAGWSMFRTMLKYKCDHAGVLFEEVDEMFSTQTCSSCGALPETRPRGIAGLGIREWTCMECGVCHDRDVNAARNILRLGHKTLVAGTPA